MTRQHGTDDYFQEFRVLPASFLSPVSDNTIFISSKFDKKSGERVVLWKDIQKGIKNADHVKDGEKLVSFMTDDDLEELIPQRIQYHPGVVLGVIVTDREQASHATPNTSILSRASFQASTQGQTNAVSNDLAHQRNRGSADIASFVQHLSNLSVATADAVDRGLAMQSAILDNEEQRLWRRDTSMEDIKISPVDDYINERLRRMGTAGIQEGDLFQVHTLRLLQMFDKRQQTLNRQVLLENRVQALMTQNYELHEYPIPRLFIVLPKPKRHKDKFIHPLKKQFRLYFLCECGEHTTGAGRGNMPNRIHLAKHEGYDLDPLVKARGVHSLRISLQWDVTLDDL
ncbi:hypothetical protein BGX34_002658 [Mortierella sp. NVP85]|nr:hypothetical protein BGX34_002658 [Mortierella sp. NVP85]